MTATLAPLPVAPIQEKLLTADEFFALRGHKRAELIDGVVVDRTPVNFDHGEIAGNIFAQFLAFLRENKAGRVSVEAGYRLKRNPDTVRAPDVSFASTEALQGQTTTSYIDGPSTIAVEVMSPGDLWSEVESKVALYLSAGTALVWIVDPQAKTLTARTRDGQTRTYTAQENVSAEPVLPGFVLRLSELWP